MWCDWHGSQLAGESPLADGFYQGFSVSLGRPAKDARLVMGAVIINHKLCLSDEETVMQIQENPYLQYFVGFQDYQTEVPFSPTLFVEIRKRMDQVAFDIFQKAIIASLAAKKARQEVQRKQVEQKGAKKNRHKAMVLMFSETGYLPRLKHLMLVSVTDGMNIPSGQEAPKIYNYR